MTALAASFMKVGENLGQQWLTHLKASVRITKVNVCHWLL